MVIIIRIYVNIKYCSSTNINTSKEMYAFSDFPPPTDWANFAHNSKVLEYMKDYATKFNLLDKIRYSSNNFLYLYSLYNK